MNSAHHYRQNLAFLLIGDFRLETKPEKTEEPVAAVVYHPEQRAQETPSEYLAQIAGWLDFDLPELPFSNRPFYAPFVEGSKRDNYTAQKPTNLFYSKPLILQQHRPQGPAPHKL